MDVKVYTGESYNAFTGETRTSYVMVDAVTGAIVQTCSCNQNTPRDVLTLTSIKRAVQALEYVDADSAIVYTDSSFAVNEINSNNKKSKHGQLISYIRRYMAALKIPVEVKFTESDKLTLPNDIAEAADYIKGFDISEAERNVAKLFGYKN